MAASLEQLTKDVANLPRSERLALAKLLLDLDRPGESTAVENAWDEEIRARVKAVDEGLATGISYTELKKEITTGFSSR
jgi:putative addiction module component (TIGR02574 family)